MTRRERWVAVILAFFFGWFGAHKFYLGQPGWGVLYFLLSETCIPAVMGLFEGVWYLLMEQDEFNAKYN